MHAATPNKNGHALWFTWCARVCMSACECMCAKGSQLELVWLSCRSFLPLHPNTQNAMPFWFMRCLGVFMSASVCMCAKGPQLVLYWLNVFQMLAVTRKQLSCRLVDRDSNKLCRLSPSNSVSPDIVFEQPPGAGVGGMGALPGTLPHRLRVAQLHVQVHLRNSCPVHLPIVRFSTACVVLP